MCWFGIKLIIFRAHISFKANSFFYRHYEKPNVFINSIHYSFFASKKSFVLINLNLQKKKAILVTHGGIAIFCYKWRNDKQLGGGLDIRQWWICIAFGFGGLVWGYILKYLPEDKCIQVSIVFFFLIFFIWEQQKKYIINF